MGDLEKLNKTTIKPVCHEGRWQVKSCYYASIRVFVLQTGNCPYPSSRSCDVIVFKQRKKRKDRKGVSFLLQPAGEQLAHVITQEQDDQEGGTDPYCATNDIYIPCLCVITFHTLHSFSLLTYTDPIFKVRACTKARNRFFVSLCAHRKCVWVFIFIYLTHRKLKWTLGHVSRDKEGEKKRIHQNKQCLAAFLLWQTTAVHNWK